MRKTTEMLDADREQQQLADDLTQWAGERAELAQLASCRADECQCEHCGPRAREDAARNRYDTVMRMSIDVLRARHADEMKELS